MPSFLYCLLQALFDRSQICQGPDPKDQLSDDLLFGNAAHAGAPGIHGCAPVVTHNEDPVFRDLVGKFDITVTQYHNR